MSSGVTAKEGSFATVATRLRVLTTKPALVAGFMALVLYLATPTANYYWDGLAFAGRIERVARHAHNAKSLFHQNHLLYNGIGYLLYVASKAFGSSIRALTVLQIASSVSCAIGVGVFFGIARRVSGSLYVAGVAACFLAVSTCWWKAATDADAYSLSAALVLVCVFVLVGERPRWYLAGLALAGAMLIHELAALFYPAAMVSVLLNNRLENRFKFALKLSAVAWGVTVVAYNIVAYLVFGITKPSDVVRWAASNPYGVSFLSPLQALRTFPQHQIDLIFGHSFTAFRRYGAVAEVTFAGIGMVAACVAGFVVVRRASLKEFVRSIWQVAPGASGQLKRTIPGLFIWISTYAVLLLFWPYTPHYRVYYAPAIVVMFVMVLSNYHLRTLRPPSRGAAVAVAALFFCNLGFFIAPDMRVNANPLAAAANEANKKWSEHSVIYYVERTAVDGALQYFNQQAEWRRASPKVIKRLDDEINLIYDQGGEVWLSESAVKSVDPAWLAGHAGGDQFTVTLDGESYRYVQLQPAR